MKVSELKEELGKRGQSTQGLKAVLLERLKEALAKHLPVLICFYPKHQLLLVIAR